MVLIFFVNTFGSFALMTFHHHSFLQSENKHLILLMPCGFVPYNQFNVG